MSLQQFGDLMGIVGVVNCAIAVWVIISNARQLNAAGAGK